MITNATSRAVGLIGSRYRDVLVVVFIGSVEKILLIGRKLLYIKLSGRLNRTAFILIFNWGQCKNSFIEWLV